jgi:hypothetical protein
LDEAMAEARTRNSSPYQIASRADDGTGYQLDPDFFAAVSILAPLGEIR